MSRQYDLYLQEHRTNVVRGFEWIEANLPELLIDDDGYYKWQITHNHDTSKYMADEYDAYDTYFYGGNKSYAVVQNFNRAWLNHIHRNPHHWQHWILINDEPGEGQKILDMEYVYILEMICDWWAFSWKQEKLDEIFSWYDAHKAYIKFSDSTRKTVEYILSKIKAKLEEGE